MRGSGSMEKIGQLRSRFGQGAGLDAQQLGLRFGEDGRGARTAGEIGDLTDQRAGLETRDTQPLALVGGNLGPQVARQQYEGIIGIRSFGKQNLARRQGHAAERIRGVAAIQRSGQRGGKAACPVLAGRQAVGAAEQRFLVVLERVIERLGGYDTSFRIAGDYDAILRYFSTDGFRAAYIPEVLVRMRVGGESNRSLGRLLRKSREDYRALRRNEVGGLATLVFKNARKTGQFF